MRRILWIILCTGITLYAEKFVVVTNAETAISALTPQEIKMIYLKKRRFWNDQKLVVLTLPPQHHLRKVFENIILEQSRKSLDAYWMKQHYQGLRPPYRVESVESMILFLNKVVGAIGYIPQTQVKDGLKVLYTQGE